MRQSLKDEILTRLSVVEKLSLGEVISEFSVSESTARRIFSEFENEGRAIRVHGGIRAINSAMTLYSFEQGAKSNIDKKAAIAKKAVSLVQNDDVIFCKVNTDDEPDLTRSFGLDAIPALLFIKNGEVKAKSVGLISKDELMKLIEANK